MRGRWLYPILEEDFWVNADPLHLLPSEQWSVFYRQVILVVYQLNYLIKEGF